MLSARAQEWSQVDFAHGVQDNYDADTNPTGAVNFGNAENLLVQDELTQFINNAKPFSTKCCSYGEGYTGTLRLRQAMSNHLNAHFEPVQPFDCEDITFSAGVTALNEACAMLACDPGEAIMLGMPVYGAFSRDLTLKTGVKLEYVPMGDCDQFSPACVAAYEAGFKDATARGVKIKALIICNPHNPLGQCYARETLHGLLALCAAKGIHLISDEIYALSVYDRPDRASESFTSVRSIDFSGLISPDQVHVLYGMSKDFSAAGLRLGCLVSQNLEFTKAARAICRFSSPSQYSMTIAASILENHQFVQQFLSKCRESLRQSRLLAERLLDEAAIPYHDKGNAGFFLWLDLSSHLPLQEAQNDGWAAQTLLAARFEKADVVMSNGSSYHAPKPGQFRIIHCLREEALREGIKRISNVLKGTQ